MGVFLDDVAAENEVLAAGVSFPTEQPFFENCYHNQKKIKTKRAMIRKATSHTLLTSKKMIWRHITKPLSFSLLLCQPQLQARLIAIAKTMLGGLE